MTENEWFEQREIELTNDIISMATIIDDYYRFHPDNPNRVDVVDEYNNLKKLMTEVEETLKQYKKENADRKSK